MSTTKEDILYGHRRSGRTTRMLRVVADNILAGKKVVVVAAFSRHLSQLVDTLSTTLLRTGLVCCSTGAKVKGLIGNFVTFATMSDSRWSIFRPSYFEGKTDQPVFIDHYVVQSVIEQLQPLLHRWDR